MSAIKAVVFDWAGTMVDFGCRAPVEALVAAFAAEGVALSAEDARRDMGRAKLDHVARPARPSAGGAGLGGGQGRRPRRRRRRPHLPRAGAADDRSRRAVQPS